MQITRFKIPLSKPYLNDVDLKELVKCFKSSWISSKSPWVTRFERLFAKKISQTNYAVAVNSGTSALFLTLKALNIGPGDEVILPTFTMIATINAVTWVGAKPILVDCQSKKDWNISVNEIERKITNKTKAIIPVHIYGYVCQMDKIIKLAKKYKLFIIEDAAEAMGSTYKEKTAGSLGDISCFSLYVNKIITTANGGVLATNNKKIYQLVKKLSFFDFNQKTHFKHHLIGYNLVLSGLQASLGYSQLKRFQQLLKKRQLIFSWYKEYLGNNKKILFINPPKEQQPNYWFPAIILKNKQEKKIIVRRLLKNGVETREFFLPIHLQPAYRNFFKNEHYPNAEYFYNHGLLLPSFYDLTKKQVKMICNLIKKINEKRRVSKDV